MTKHFHQMRRLLGMGLALILLLSFCVTAYAAGEYIHGYFRYRIEDNSVIITAYTGRETVVTVPAMIGGNPVNTIASGAFEKNTSVTTIYLPDTIMSVENGAFGAGQTVIYSWDDDNTGGNNGNNDNNNNGGNTQTPEDSNPGGTWGNNGNSGTTGSWGNPAPEDWGNAESIPDEDGGFGSEEVVDEELTETKDNTPAETPSDKNPSSAVTEQREPVNQTTTPAQTKPTESSKPDTTPVHTESTESSGTVTTPAVTEPPEPVTAPEDKSENPVTEPADGKPEEPKESDDKPAQNSADTADIASNNESDGLRPVVAIVGGVVVFAAIASIVLRKKYHGH